MSEGVSEVSGSERRGVERGEAIRGVSDCVKESEQRVGTSEGCA